MTKLTAISNDIFADKAWLRPAGYSFAAGLATIPVVAAELPSLVPAMPLGFVKNGSTFDLVAICSLKPSTNLYVAPDGRWLGSYVPAVLRSYPFRLAKAPGREDSILCIDEGSGAVVGKDHGIPFFDASGEPATALKDILNLLTQIERSSIATQAAIAALASAGLIQPWPLRLQQGDQPAAAVDGLFRIDEAAMNALSEENFLKLRGNGAFAVAYAQLLSMHQLGLLQRLDQVQAELKAQAEAQMNALSALEGLFQDDGTITFTY